MESAAWYRQLSRGQVHGVVAAMLGFLLDGFDFALMSFVLVDIAREFQLSLPVAASLLGAAFTSRWLAGPILGSIADRYGRRGAMIAAIWIYSLGTAACGLAWGYWPMFVCRAVVGIGMAGEYSASAAYVIEICPESWKNKASGAMLAAFALGGIVASKIYPLIVPHLGWRALFYLGLLPVLATLYVRAYAPESIEWRQARRDGTAGGISAARILAPPLLGMTLLLCATAFIFFFGAWPILGLLPTWLRGSGYTAADIGNVTALAGLGTMIGAVGGGVIADRFGTSRVIAISLLCSIVFLVPVFVLAHPSVALLSALVLLMQMTLTGMGGLMPKWVAEHFQPQWRGAGVGLVYNVGAFGGFFGPTMAAAVARHIGLGGALLGIVLCLVLLTAVAVATDLPRRLTNRRTPEPARA